MKGTNLEQLMMSYQKQVNSIVNKTSFVTKKPLLSHLMKEIRKHRPRGKAYLRMIDTEYPRNS